MVDVSHVTPPLSAPTLASRATRRQSLPSTLRGADLRKWDLTDADLGGRDLSGADLRGAVLFGAQLGGAMLLGANLRGADLREVRAEKANFGRADLSDALLFGAALKGASFVGANLSNADLSGSNLSNASLGEANLCGTNLARAVACGASFDNANVAEACFDSCSLERARFSHARNFETASWIDADLAGGDFRGAHALYRFALDENYLFEFRERNRTHALIYLVWRLTSDCGRSLGRWMLFIGAVAVAFSVAYMHVGIDYGANETWLSPLYFSVVTLTTLGFGDALPVTAMAQLTVIAEVVLGYLFLGGLVSILANKLARRAA